MESRMKSHLLPVLKGSVGHPALQPFVDLRRGPLKKLLGPGHFVAETFKVVDLLLRSPHEVLRVLTTPEYLKRLEPALLSRFHQTGSSPDTWVLSQAEMEKIVGFNLHQGVMALARRPEDTPLLELGPRIVVLNGVVNPENVGSITRSGAALGPYGILSDGGSADPYLRRCVRVSMGSVFSTPVRRSSQLGQDLMALKEAGYAILGSDARRPTATLEDFIFPEKFAVVVGSEVRGMDEGLWGVCDHILKIETEERSPTLNASHSAAVLFYASRLGGALRAKRSK